MRTGGRQSCCDRRCLSGRTTCPPVGAASTWCAPRACECRRFDRPFKRAENRCSFVRRFNCSPTRTLTRLRQFIQIVHQLCEFNIKYKYLCELMRVILIGVFNCCILTPYSYEMSNKLMLRNLITKEAHLMVFGEVRIIWMRCSWLRFSTILTGPANAQPLSQRVR